MTSRRPPLSLCRWLMLAALALSVVLQPVLGSVSDLLELSHGAASVHDISETGAPDEEGNAAGTLHVMHQLGSLLRACGAYTRCTAGAARDQSQRTHEPDGLAPCA